MQPSHAAVAERYRTWIATLIILGTIVWVLYPVYQRAEYNLSSPEAGCQSNLKQIGLGLLQYSQDYDERFPAVALSRVPDKRHAYGWGDALQLYLKSTLLYHCPAHTKMVEDTRRQTDPQRPNYTDYWLNRRLADGGINGIAELNATFLCGDGNAGEASTSARYALSRLPPRWLSDTSSPAYRHLNGVNFLFADGHVKWLDPRKVSSSSSSGPSFATK